MLANTSLSFESVRRNACVHRDLEYACVHREDLGLYSHPRGFFLKGMESEPIITPREKSPLLEAQMRVEPTTLHHAGQRAPTHYPQSYPRPLCLNSIVQTQSTQQKVRMPENIWSQYLHATNSSSHCVLCWCCDTCCTTCIPAGLHQLKVQLHMQRGGGVGGRSRPNCHNNLLQLWVKTLPYPVTHVEVCDVLGTHENNCLWQGRKPHQRSWQCDDKTWPPWHSPVSVMTGTWW